MKRKKIDFTKDESKKRVQRHLREVIPPMTFQNLKKAIFQLVKAPFSKFL